MESTTVTRPTTDGQPADQPPPSGPPPEPRPGRRRPATLTGGWAGRLRRFVAVAGPPARTLARAAAGQVRTNLRLPDRETQAPHPVRLAGICAWAALLGLAGLLVAARVAVAIIAGTSPGWYEPAVVAVGVLGIALTACAFAAVHRPRVPWLLLTAATLPLMAGGWLALSL